MGSVGELHLLLAAPGAVDQRDAPGRAGDLGQAALWAADDLRRAGDIDQPLGKSTLNGDIIGRGGAGRGVANGQGAYDLISGPAGGGSEAAFYLQVGLDDLHRARVCGVGVDIALGIFPA